MWTKVHCKNITYKIKHGHFNKDSVADRAREVEVERERERERGRENILLHRSYH